MWLTMLRAGNEGMGLVRWLLLGLLLIGCAIGTGSAVDVTGPVVIDKPGTYTLTKDILDVDESVCIEIVCDDVVLDGKGHLIRGNDAENSAGVLVHSTGPISNVIVRNVRTTDWFYGIYFWGAHNGRVDGCTATSNYFGLAFNPSSDSTVSNSRFISNNHGLVMTGSTRDTITGCTISGSKVAGISLYGSAGNTFSNNLLNNEKNVAFVNEGSTSNAWNAEKRDGPNIVGGPTIGGNCWKTPGGTGYSERGSQSGGFITQPYTLSSGNIDRLPLAADPETDTTLIPTTPQGDETGSDSSVSKAFVAHRLPCTIQAEDYDLGGPGVGYFTPYSTTNTVYRKGTIRIARNTNESGYHLTGTRYGEWLRYTVEVPRTGMFSFSARVSSPTGGQYFKVVDECHPKMRLTIWAPNTGSYDTFKMTKKISLRLTKGTHTFKVFSYGTQDMDLFLIS
jgi:parallel beta-helix repeat protein